MPTVEKLEKYDVQGENTEVKDEIRENVRGTLPAAKTKLMHTRSAFSDTDLKGRLATIEKGGTADNGVFSRYSESDLAVARLSVPLFDDSRSEASGGSGLAIVPYGDERSLVSQDSVRDVVLVESNEVITIPDGKTIPSGQGNKGTVNLTLDPVVQSPIKPILD